MIVVQTPLRVSFLGGGTDFAGYYEQEGGCVLSSAIDKYIHVIVKRRFDATIRLGYTRTEWVESVDDLQHELIREALRLTSITRQIEIATLGDIPAQGSGLGSSSTVTVGSLHAMYAHQGRLVDAETLAQQACQIEIDILGKPIGKQDQYIAAYGGLRFIEFKRDGSVNVQAVQIEDEARRALDERLLLFYTGVTRKADAILEDQVARIDQRLEALRGLKALANEARADLEHGRLDALGGAMDRGWELKQSLSARISNDAINGIYDDARRAGALGGKIAGAGGGGFLFLYCPPKAQDAVRFALRGLQEMPFRLESDGSKVIFNARRD